VAPVAGGMTDLVRIEGLERRYAGVVAVDGLSFAVEEGSITGLIGPNGSGKSTTIDCVTGFQPADGGRWWLDGREITGWPPHRVALAGMTRTFQNVRAFEELTLLDNLRQAAQPADRIGWADAFLASRRLRAAEADARARAERLLDLVGLSRYADAPAKILSYGQRKLLAFAATLMSRPRIVVLDEPVAGVNPTMIRQVEAAIRRANGEGVTLLIVEHNVDFIMTLCGRVVVLDAGRKIAEGAPGLIRSDPRVLEAYLGGTVDA